MGDGWVVGWYEADNNVTLRPNLKVEIHLLDTFVIILLSTGKLGLGLCCAWQKIIVKLRLGTL